MASLMTPTLGQPVSRNAVREQVMRISRSPLFVQSTMLSHFLRYTVEAALTNQAASIKEYVIGTEVYGRPTSFNPNEDSIVRSEARRLRTKLKEYYQSLGKDDLVFIGYKPGSYVPVIESNESQRAQSATSYVVPAQTAGTQTDTARIRILSVEDHPVFREGLRAIITSQPDLMLVAQAADAPGAIEQFNRHLPDVTLLDIRLLATSGLDALDAIRKQFPDACIVMLTTFDGDREIQRAMRGGASGYVLKSAPEEEILAVIRAVHAGRRYVSPELGARLADRAGEVNLTDREVKVLNLIRDGARNEQIAEELAAPESSVPSAISELISRLGANDRAHALTIALRRGLLQI